VKDAARRDTAVPAAIPLRETLRFLERALPPSPARVLEVGCGGGAVARSLAAAGYRITALDEAIDRGGDPPESGDLCWVEADFLYYEDGNSYDVVLFARSLHHMAPVEAALDRARDLLRPGGLLVAEEFAFDRVNLPTARWLYDLESVLLAAGMLAPAPGESGDEGNPLGRWRREHASDPPLQTGHAILAAARERFDLAAVEEAPYLYRYFCGRLEPTERGARVGRRVLELETRLIRERDLAAAGLRLIGRRRD
jgi:SAM-dependent methyltransferase